MKYMTFIVGLLFLGLTGCSIHPETKNLASTLSYTGKIHPDKKIINYPDGKNKHIFKQSDGFDIPLTGILSTENKIGPHISINNNTLTYDGIFTIKIPDDIYAREYHVGGLEILSLSTKQPQSYFSLQVGNPSLSTEREDDIIKCQDIVVGSISTISKNINGKTIYINTINYPESAVVTKELCFVKNDVVYKISLSNYNNNIITNIFDSFMFLEKEPQITTTPGSYSGWHVLLPNMTGIYNNIIISGKNLVYKNLFSINIPEYIQFWQILRPSTHLVDIYFVDKIFYGFQMDDIRFINLIITPAILKNGESEYDMCSALQHNQESDKSEIDTRNNIVVYKNYRSYDSFGYAWKQGNICFVYDGLIYLLSVRLYTVSDVISTINSFHPGGNR